MDAVELAVGLKEREVDAKRREWAIANRAFWDADAAYNRAYTEYRNAWADYYRYLGLFWAAGGDDRMRPELLRLWGIQDVADTAQKAAKVVRNTRASELRTCTDQLADLNREYAVLRLQYNTARDAYYDCVDRYTMFNHSNVFLTMCYWKNVLFSRNCIQKGPRFDMRPDKDKELA